jgi:3-isopropylmalate/(R)-2-methylmalate dehydratase small subunit
MAAIELPKEQIDELMTFAGDVDAAISIDVPGQSLTVSGGGRQKTVQFEVSPFDKALVLAGGWVDYADSKY